MLYGAFLSVSQFDFDFALLLAGAGIFTTNRAILCWFFALALAVAANCAGFGRIGFATARAVAATAARLGFDGLAIPFRITKMLVGLHEIIHREKILVIKQAGAPADDLFELDHGIDRAHQYDVANIARVHTG